MQNRPSVQYKYNMETILRYWHYFTAAVFMRRASSVQKMKFTWNVKIAKLIAMKELVFQILLIWIS